MKAFFASLSVIILVVIAQSFFTEDEKLESGVFEDVRQVESFSNITISGALDVDIKSGSTNEIVIKSGTGHADYVKTFVKNETLFISPKKMKIPGKAKIDVFVTAAMLEKLNVSGACDVNVFDETNRYHTLKFNISGASDIYATGEYNDVHLNVSGASDVKMDGFATEAKYIISGSSDIKAQEFVVDHLDVNVSGASDVKATAVKTIKYSASGASDLKYAGNPQVLKKSKTGAADVKRIED